MYVPDRPTLTPGRGQIRSGLGRPTDPPPRAARRKFWVGTTPPTGFSAEPLGRRQPTVRPCRAQRGENFGSVPTDRPTLPHQKFWAGAHRPTDPTSQKNLGRYSRRHLLPQAAQPPTLIDFSGPVRPVHTERTVHTDCKIPTTVLLCTIDVVKPAGWDARVAARRAKEDQEAMLAHKRHATESGTQKYADNDDSSEDGDCFFGY